MAERTAEERKAAYSLYLIVSSCLVQCRNELEMLELQHKKLKELIAVRQAHYDTLHKATDNYLTTLSRKALEQVLNLDAKPEKGETEPDLL